MSTWLLVRLLHGRGQSEREIARVSGVCRKTVRRVLATKEWPEVERPAPVQLALSEYRRLAEDGLRKGKPGDSILSEVEGLGYSGSRATFYRWLRHLREELRGVAWTDRFETGPAEQCQFDWSPYGVCLGGVLTPVIIYSTVLCYSRRIHWHVSLSEKLESVLEGLECGFLHFGGVCRSVVVDNARAMVLMHRRSLVRFNEAFLGLCVHYHVCPIAATPGHPRGKGKVENPFGVFESGFLLGGGWRSLEHLVEEVGLYEARREEKTHHTTGAAPAERFKEEQHLLTGLPRRIFLGAPSFVRRVNNDATISYGGVRYHIPSEGLTRLVRVRTERGRHFCVYNAAGVLIHRGEIQPPGTGLVICQASAETRNALRRSSLKAVMERFRQRYGAQGDVVEEFLKQLLRRHPNRPERGIGYAFELLSGAPDDAALATMAEAVELNLSDAEALRTLLGRRLRGHPVVHAPIPTVLPALPVCNTHRPLEHYARALVATPACGSRQERTAKAECHVP